MKKKDIEKLIGKYLEGKTTPAEERLLAQELQRPDIPEDWQAIRMMLGELAIGEAEYDAIIDKRHHRAHIIALRIISSMAAVLLIGLFLYQHLPTENVNEVPHYNTSNLTAGNTLKNVYINRQHQDKLLSYTKFKTMLYENK